MGRQRKNDQDILTILNASRQPLTFSEIKQQYMKKNHKCISDYSLVNNLTLLVARGDVNRKTVFGQSLRGKIVYELTKSFYQRKVKEVVVQQIGQASNVETRYADIVPAIFFDAQIGDPQEIESTQTEDSWLAIEGSLESLRQAATNHFSVELSQLLVKAFSKKQREEVLQLLVVLFWTGAQLACHVPKEDPIKIEKLLKPMQSKSDLQSSFAELVKEMEEDKAKGRPWELRSHMIAALEFLDPDLEFQEFEIHRSTEPIFSKIHVLRMLSEATPYLFWLYGVERVAPKIEATLEASKKFYDGHRQLFHEFMKKLKMIRFMILIYCGIPEIETNLELMGLEDFDKWEKALKEGDVDGHSSVFNEGLRNIEKTIRCLKKGLTIPRFSYIDIYDPEGTSVEYLYYNHPEGKSVAFWERIREQIQARRDEIRSKESQS